MRIDRKLNLVLPVEREDGLVYVHSTPISEDVFKRYFEIISQTMNAIFTQGHGAGQGPRIAAMLLEKYAKLDGIWEGPEGVQMGLMAEIRRLTNVILPGENGWETVPLEVAIKRDAFSQQDVNEIEGAIVFFTVASCMLQKSMLPVVAKGGLATLWGAQTTSSDCTEYARSLQTLTETASSGETLTTSSVPG